MTTYRLFPSTNGPATAVSYSGNFISGVAFTVSQGGMWFQGYWYWCAAGANPSPTGATKCALWSLTAGGTGHLVAGSVVTSGTLTAGAWNYIPLSTPIQIAPGYSANSTTNGSAYIAAVGVNGNFSDTNSMFNSGDTYAAGITNGPLIAYSGTTGSKPAPLSLQQGIFSVAGTDPSTTMPATGDSGGDGGSNFWVDVQVSDAPPPGYTGSYRLWPNKSDANAFTGGDAAVNYTIATEIHLTQPCALNNIWYFSPNGTGAGGTATTLATRADVWNISTQLAVASITSPSWSGAAGTGWIKAAFPAGTTLPPGSYRVSIYNSAGTSDANWGPKDASTDYWGETTTGVGGNGITAGPLFAPGYSTASSGFLFSNGATGPPPNAGSATSHAQPVFYQPSTTGGAVGFPQLNAPVGASSNQTQNYWIDLEATPLVFDEPLSAQVSPTWQRQFRHRMVLPGPVIAVNGSVTGVTAALALAAPAGSVAVSAGATGVTAGLTLAAPAGTISASSSVTGTVAALTLAAPAGSVSAAQTVTGVAAALTLTAPAGMPVAGAQVAGTVAALALAAPAGSVSASSSVTGTVAALTLAAPAGIAPGNQNISGVTAALTLRAAAGTVFSSTQVRNAVSAPVVSQRVTGTATVTQRATSAPSVSGG